MSLITATTTSSNSSIRADTTIVSSGYSDHNNSNGPETTTEYSSQSMTPSNSIYHEVMPGVSPSKSLNSLDWTRIQEKAFVRWINYKLQLKNYDTLLNLHELGQGLYLFHLIDCLLDHDALTTHISNSETTPKDTVIGNETGAEAGTGTGTETEPEFIYKYIQPPYAKPISKIQMMENMNVFLQDLKFGQRLQIHNIGAEDILDGNNKLILGLIWTIILHYTSFEYPGDDGSDSDDSISKRELLLRWVKRVTEGYEGVTVRNFTSSWVDGLAFCAILDYFEPDMMKYEGLDLDDGDFNLSIALDVAESLGICKLLDADDIQMGLVDDKSLMAYVSLWFDKFSSYKLKTDKQKKANPKLLKIRMETFVNAVDEVVEFKNEYLTSYHQLFHYLTVCHDKLTSTKEPASPVSPVSSVDQSSSDSDSQNSGSSKAPHSELIQLRANLREYKRSDKLQIGSDYNHLVFLKIKLNITLNQYKLSKFPDSHLLKIKEKMHELRQLEVKLTKLINGKVENLVKSFNSFCAKIESALRLVHNQLIELLSVGNLAQQIDGIKLILTDLETVNVMLNKVITIRDQIVSLTDASVESVEFRVYELTTKYNDFTENCYSQLSFINSQFGKVDKIKKTLGKARIEPNYEELDEIAAAHVVEDGSSSGSSMDAHLKVAKFKLIFRKFDHGEKGYLNKCEFKESMKYMFTDLKDSEIDEFFEILYKTSSEILRGVRLRSFLKLLKKLYDIEDDAKDAFNEAEFEVSDDELVNMLGGFHLRTFQLISDDSKVISVDDLKRIRLDDAMITKMQRFLNGSSSAGSVLSPNNDDDNEADDTNTTTTTTTNTNTATTTGSATPTRTPTRTPTATPAATNNLKSFNYFDFFMDNEHSLLMNMKTGYTLESANDDSDHEFDEDTYSEDVSLKSKQSKSGLETTNVLDELVV
ncbi:unnamed protein product [Ambrosiozyma monospora]|uniref:Unnamed protein product n=1 Tax=Ambrosiozyma monospora TaxID=43982 RepID=A0A9W6YTM3_AMBMO|nr:unnamed protein product [Ambrosiozyma monospora]